MKTEYEQVAANNETPLVSIIIPTYNRAHLIGETLDSILDQTYPNWECIIVDDGSSDNTDTIVGAYVAKDERFKYYHRPDTHKPGGNGARNYGFKMSKGDYVNWFDSDDLMLDNFLSIAKNTLHKSALDFALFDYKIFTNNKENVFYIQKNQSDNLLEDYVTFKINFGTCAIIWNRNIISKFTFNEDLTKAQDLDFNFRIFTQNNFNHSITN
jgi:glycosyltransferase involved in cell wall biosynthesis